MHCHCIVSFQTVCCPLSHSKLCVVTCCAFVLLLMALAGQILLRACEDDVRWIQGDGYHWAAVFVVQPDGIQFAM